MNEEKFLQGKKFLVAGTDTPVYYYHHNTGRLSKNEYLAFEVESISEQGFLASVDVVGIRRSVWINFVTLTEVNP